MSSTLRRTLLFWAIAALLLGLLAWRTAGRRNEGDLRVYYETVSRVGEGKDLYHQRETSEPDRPTAYIYPPLFAVLFLPFTSLPFPVVRGLWFFLMGLLALRCYRVSLGLIGVRIPARLETRLAILAVALGVLYSLRFSWSDLGHGQVNLLVMWLTVEGIAQAERRRDLPAGALLAAAILIKLTPGIVLVGYLLGRRWRVGAGAAAAGGVGLLLPALVVGWSENVSYVTRFVTEVTPWNAQFHTAVGNNASLSGWIQRMLVGQAPNAGMEPQRLLLSLDPGGVQVLCRIVSGVILCAALAGAHRLGKLRGPALLLAAIPLISPIAWKPHLVCLILPGLLAGRLLLVPGRHRACLGVGLVLLGLTGRLLLGRDLADQALVWGAPTLGIVLLAVGLVLAPDAEVEPDLQPEERRDPVQLP